MARMFDNRYEIKRRLGSGGMADVYLAQDTHLGREVAIKVLHKQYSNDEEFVARFRQEAQSAAGLSHPHIVSIYDRGEAGGNYYIAMEYLRGKSLKDIIAENKRLSPSQSIEIAEQILQALQFAHEHDVIHRDIKPHNIVINGRNQVKVTDFGIARAGTSSRMTETGSIIGTAQYLSPEQAKGKAVEQSSDLYSLGIVLYEMLTGTVPFEGENPVAIALKHLSDDPVPPQTLAPDIPDNLNMVVMKALTKNPASRYGSAEEFLADLDRCRKDLPVAAPILAATAATGILTAGEAAAMMSDAGPGTGQTVVQPRSRQIDEKSSRRKWAYTVLLLALLVAAAVAAVGYYIAFVSDQSVEVPGVVGLDEQTARDTLEAKGFVVDAEASESSETVPAGQVLRQNPDAGSSLKKGGTVRLVISVGSSMIAVPDLLGQSTSYVESKLEEFGLRPDRQPDVYSESVPEGSIISQDPPAGTRVEAGSLVKYTVSKGTQPVEQVSVPDLSRMTVGEATAALTNAKLAIGHVTEEFMTSIPVGQVINQTPAAGQKVDAGSSVNIVISKGPEVAQASVPNVVGMSQAAATSQITSKSLNVTVHESTTSDPSIYGKVISQSPAGETLVDVGSTVIIVVGKAP